MEVRLITPEDIAKYKDVNEAIAILKSRAKYPEVEKSKYKYKPYKKHLTLCHGIADLHPFECTLPDAPPIEQFVNYGLPPAEQYFQRIKIPEALTKIDRDVKYGQLNRQEAIAQIQAAPELVEFVEMCWLKRLTGDWQLINGEPTHIPPTYFFYLGFWHMDVGLPQFRSDRHHHCGDLELFYCWDYLVVPSPYCYGIDWFTQRRVGKTYIGGCLTYEPISRSQEWHGGIQSKTDTDAEKAFTKSIVKAWRRLPCFFQPIYSNSTMPKKEGLQFTPRGKKGKNDAIEVMDEEELMSDITYGASGAMFYDGQKLHRYFSDENGKCLAKDTPILMHNGTIKMVQDVEAGDLLMGDDSKPRKVLKTNRGKEEMYDVVPNKGMIWGCNKSHILSLKSCSDAYGYKKGEVVNISVEEYEKLVYYKKKNLVLWRTGVEYKEKKHTIPPYLLGLWLGDGLSHNPAICNTDREVIDYIYEYCKNNLLNVRISDTNNYHMTYGCGKKVRKISKDGGCVKEYLSASACARDMKTSVSQIVDVCKNKKFYKGFYWNRDEQRGNGFLNSLNDMNLLHNKHIPFEYLVDKRENRLELLAGLIDTDGHFTKVGNRVNYEITQKNKTLAYHIHSLANSLGFYCSINKKMAQMKRKDGSVYKCLVYRLGIFGSNLHTIPCKIKRKICPEIKDKHKNTRNPLRTGFKLQTKGIGEYYGFTISGNHLFLLGDYTVTHNTTEVDVYERWNVVKPCLWENDGTGNRIKGKAFFSTTVEESDKKGGKYYKPLWMDGDRNPDKKADELTINEDGETICGLWNWFMPAHCNEVWDRYGIAIVETPNKEQQQYLKLRGDKNYSIGGMERVNKEIENQTDEYKKQDIIRKKPRNIKEAFQSVNNFSYFKTSILKKRLNDFTFGYLEEHKKLMKFGKFDWVGEPFNSDVEFIETDFRQAKLYSSYFPPDGMRNLRIPGGNGKFKPANASMFRSGADPFKYDTRDVKNKKDMSMGTQHIYAFYDPQIDAGKERKDWLTNNLVYEYWARPDSVDELCEDYAKACIFYSCKLYPERNNDDVIKYFKSKGLDNYIQLGIRLTTSEGGIFFKQEIVGGNITTDKTIEKLFRHVQNWVNEDAAYCMFPRTLQDVLDVDRNDLNPYDLFVSLGYTLMSAYEADIANKQIEKRQELPANILAEVYGRDLVDEYDD